jgi:hypothetical protein
MGRRLATLALAVLSLAALGAPARGADIFIPPPRRADETVDEDAAGGYLSRDIVVTVNGDELRGDITSIDRSGKLRMRSPYFDGEARLLLAKLKSISFNHATADAGRDRICLTNGDYIAGELVSISDADIIVESVVAGFIRIPVGNIHSIMPSAGLEHLLDSDFRRGTLEPWRRVQGTWTVGGGVLFCQQDRRSRQAILAARLDQREALTLEVRIAGARESIEAELAMFSDGTDGGTGRNCLKLVLRNMTAKLYRVDDGSAGQIGGGSLSPLRAQELELLLAYDPDSGRANVQANSEHVWEGVLAEPLESGTHIVLTSRDDLSVRRIRVRRGMLTSAAAEARADPKNDTVFLTNGSRMAASSVTLNNNVLTVETAVGPLTCPLEDVREMLFSIEGRRTVEWPEADALVRAGGNRLTLKLESMGREHLTGTSVMLGRVRLAREAIEEVTLRPPP